MCFIKVSNIDDLLCRTLTLWRFYDSINWTRKLGQLTMASRAVTPRTMTSCATSHTWPTISDCEATGRTAAARHHPRSPTQITWTTFQWTNNQAGSLSIRESHLENPESQTTEVDTWSISRNLPTIIPKTILIMFSRQLVVTETKKALLNTKIVRN